MHSGAGCRSVGSKLNGLSIFQDIVKLRELPRILDFRIVENLKRGNKKEDEKRNQDEQ